MVEVAQQCLFCNIIAGSIPSDKIYEDELVLVFKDIHPKAEVHFLIVPKQHFAGLHEMQAEHDAVMTHSLRLLPKLAQQHGLEGGFRTIINTGKDGGQEVFHLHIHLLGGASLPGF